MVMSGLEVIGGVEIDGINDWVKGVVGWDARRIIRMGRNMYIVYRGCKGLILVGIDGDLYCWVIELRVGIICSLTLHIQPTRTQPYTPIPLR